MKTSTDIPLILKQPMHPLHRHILSGYPPEWYPGDEAYPVEIAQFEAWEQAMKAEQASDADGSDIAA